MLMFMIAKELTPNVYQAITETINPDQIACINNWLTSSNYYTWEQAQKDSWVLLKFEMLGKV